MKNVLRMIIDYIQKIAGVPDYDQYVQYMRVYQPNQPTLGEKEFFRKAIDERYGGDTIRKCC